MSPGQLHLDFSASAASAAVPARGAAPPMPVVAAPPIAAAVPLRPSAPAAEPTLPLLPPDANAATPAFDQLRAEIAALWCVPLGLDVEIVFRDYPVDAARGRLDLSGTPDHPWNRRDALRLRLAGLEFTSRHIERWTLL